METLWLSSASGIHIQNIAVMLFDAYGVDSLLERVSASTWLQLPCEYSAHDAEPPPQL